MTDEIRNKFIKLIEEFGDDNELFIFNYCSDYGIELNGSTIDCIVLAEGRLRFVYNENTNDYDHEYYFEESDLEDFYEALYDAMAEERFADGSAEKEIEDEITPLLTDIFPDEWDRQTFVSNITDLIIADIQETADPLFWHSGDIAIAFPRALMRLSEIGK